MNRVSSCDRCGSKIVESPHGSSRPEEFHRVEGRDGQRVTYEVDAAHLCSMCLDDVWEFVFEEEIDRSGVADPVPLAKMGENVERFIDDLESVLDAIDAERVDE